MESASTASSAIDQLARLLLMGPLGIAGPILIIVLCLWLGRGDHSPRYIKALLWAALAILLLILFRYI